MHQEEDKKIAAVKDDIKGEGVEVNKPGDRAAYVNKLYDQSLTLELLTVLGSWTTLPLVVKGILRGDTAEIAARHPNVRQTISSTILTAALVWPWPQEAESTSAEVCVFWHLVPTVSHLGARDHCFEPRRPSARQLHRAAHCSARDRERH